MCRYAFNTYKSHFACFNCRKTFKQAPYTDLLQRIGKAKQYERLRRKPTRLLNEKEIAMLDDFKKQYRNRAIKCPQCSGYMADLGLDFKSPRQTAVKKWKIIEGLYTIGKNFHSCGCTGIGYIPQNPKDYTLYLQRVLNDYAHQIASCQDTPLDECPDKAERIKYWNDRLLLVRAELSQQKQFT